MDQTATTNDRKNGSAKCRPAMCVVAAKLKTIVFDTGYMRDVREKEVAGETKNAHFDPDRIIPRVISSKADKTDKSKAARIVTHAIAGKHRQCLGIASGEIGVEKDAGKHHQDKNEQDPKAA